MLPGRYSSRSITIASCLACFLGGSATAADDRSQTLISAAKPVSPSGAASGESTEPGFRPRIRGIMIQNASYGRPGTSQICDVTDALKRSCDAKMRCQVRVEPGLCKPPATPPTVLIPQLKAEYLCWRGDKVRISRGDRLESVLISCPATGPIAAPDQKANRSGGGNR